MNNVLYATCHFLRSAARKCQQQDPFGADSLNNKMGDAMGERHRLAGSGSCYDKQWSCRETTTVLLCTIFGGEPLRRVKKTQMIEFPLGNLHGIHPCKSLYFYTVLDVFTSIASGRSRSRLQVRPGHQIAACVRLSR